MSSPLWLLPPPTYLAGLRLISVPMQIDTYYTLLNSPVSRGECAMKVFLIVVLGLLELISSGSSELSILLPNSSTVQWSAKLREDIVDNDPFSKMRDEVRTC